MKTEEDEAFDDLAKKQGSWGGGFQAKRAAAADKLHWSDCAVHNAPAYPAGECDCDARLSKYAETLLYTAPPQPAQDGKCKLCIDGCAACGARAHPAQEPEREAFKLALDSENPDIQLRVALAIRADLAQPAQEAIYGMNQDDWKDVVAAISKVRDGRGIYLGCRPADVFQEWFLALGTAKVKEKNND